MFETIVFASNLTDVSRAVANSLGKLEHIGAKKAILLHVIASKDEAQSIAEHEQAARAKLEEERRILESLGYEVTPELRHGLTYQEILEAAQRHDASAVVMHTTAQRSIGDLFRGAVAHEVINKASVPVMLMRVKTNIDGANGAEVISPDFSAHLLYPTDFSANADRALAYVERIVETGCRKVTLMHVQDRARISGHLEHRLEEFNEIDKGRLETIKTRLEQAGPVEVRYELFYGSPAQEILREAEEGDYSLLVLGSQGRGFIPEVYLGSVSHKVVCYAPAPILLIPAER